MFTRNIWVKCPQTFGHIVYVRVESDIRSRKITEVPEMLVVLVGQQREPESKCSVGKVKKNK